MIKTVSFAPPRAASGASSKPSSKVAARSAAVQHAKARVQALPAPANVPVAPLDDAPALSSLFPRPSAPAAVSAAQVREQLQSTAPASPARARGASAPSTSASQKSKRAPRAAQVEPSLELFPLEAAPAFPLEVAPAPLVPLVVSVVEVEARVSPTGSGQAIPSKPQPVKRAKRVKVPANLAEQYGQSLSKRAQNGVEVPVVEEESPKKRLNRAERAARRELMNPDDELRARLARAQNMVPSTKPEKRPRGWRFDCGRCGQTSYFGTAGALCSCGAVALKE